MSEPTAPTAPSPPRLGDAVRLVLFGMPAAGKSSLLGALGQAAQAQEHVLGGRLLDASHGLEELRQRLYEGQPRRTVEEIVPYPVTFEPFDSSVPARDVPGVLIDCDGRVANDLLVRRQSLDADTPEGSLARAVLQADTLVLVIDASAPASQVDADFAEFDRFLRLLERSRGRRAEVGGLPVFLVLTKCDLLARPGDTALEWMERVEERKRQVDRRFREFLKRKEEENGPLPFGRIDLHVWATAVKRPALAEVPAKPREPYGVAELFRQGFAAAEEFRRRRQRSGRRLLWTVAGASGLVATLLGYAVWVGQANLRVETPSELQNKVEIVRSGEKQTPSGRLEGSRDALARRIAELTDLKNHRDFAQLPEELRDWVDQRLGELREYDNYYRKLLEARPPASARGLAELSEIEEGLKTALAVPRDEWSETRAARIRRERLEEVTEVRAAVRRVQDWYAQLRDRGEALWTFDRRQPGVGGASIDWRAWQSDARNLLASAEAPPFRETDRLHEPDGPTYRDTVLRFESVAEARADWERTRQRLLRLLDLSAALGLGLTPERPPVLVFTDNLAFQPAEFRDRLQALKKSYPRYEEEFRLVNLPEAAVGDIRQAARGNYSNLLAPAREVVLRRLQAAGSGEEEAPTRWQEVQRWLQGGPEELSDWRLLARVLRRLHEPDALEPDPVSELASFLTRDRFEIVLRRASLTLPTDLGVSPAGNLSVVHESNGQSTTLTLEPLGEPQRDPQGRVRTYTLRAVDADRIVYRPGDVLYARVPVRRPEAAGDWWLTWAWARSSLYRFEALSRGAYLHRANEVATEGRYADEVRLTPLGESRAPSVPDLMPVVRLKR